MLGYAWDCAVTPCDHPPGKRMYRHLNVSQDLRITAADLLGGINPYVWRVEYCGKCNAVLREFGDVPENVRAEYQAKGTVP